MIEVLQSISGNCFEPFFAAGLVGWGFRLCFGRKESDNEARLRLLAGILVIMMGWRCAIHIISGRYALNLFPLLLLGMAFLGSKEYWPKLIPEKIRLWLGIATCTVLAVVGTVRCMTMQQHQKDFSSLSAFLRQEASQCEAPLFLCMNGEENRLSYYTDQPFYNGMYAPDAEPLKGYAPWLNDRVYCIYSYRNCSTVCTINGEVPKEIFRDKNTKTVVFCWKNPNWPGQPKQESTGNIPGKTVCGEDFEQFSAILPGTNWKILEARGLVIPEAGVSVSRLLSPNPGHHLNDLHGAEIRVTGRKEDMKNGLVLNGKHSFLISLPLCGGGFLLPGLTGGKEYRASLRFKGTPGSRFQIMYYGCGIPVVYGACRNQDTVYVLSWELPLGNVKSCIPVIYVEKGSRLIFDDLVIQEVAQRKE